MKSLHALFFVCVMLVPLGGGAQTLWYDQPADEWMKSLPIGNGRLGVMVYGGVMEERLALNESSMWSGGPNERQNRRFGRAKLDTLRQLFFSGDLIKGNEMANHYLIGDETNFGSHVPLGDIVLRFHYGDTLPVTNYKRSLSLQTAIANVEYRRGDVAYSREYFCSHPHDAFVARYSANRRGSISFEVATELLRPEATVHYHDDGLEIVGKASQPGRTDGGVQFITVFRIAHRGGNVSLREGAWEVSGADEVILYADLRTDYHNPGYQNTCKAGLQRVSEVKYERLRRNHIEDYSPLFARVSLSLGDASADSLSTDSRWQKIKDGGDDVGLQALFAQYGRYLTIISSREDSPLPIALQGFFNDNLACNMGWNNDYHLDINTQQNYWLTNVGNLAECNAPLFTYIADLAEAGARTAQSYYDCRGWMAHCTANIWGFTAPAGYIGWGLHVTGGCWLATHLWMHFDYTRDRYFLRATAYPLLKGCALFLLDYMCQDPATGYLLTGPSISPENSFGWNGKNLCASMMPTVDLVLSREILEATLHGAELLGVDAGLCDSLRYAISLLPPLRVNKYGGLREWYEDYDDVNANHRHTSHLLALYPYNQITTRRTPELACAAYNTMLRRLSAEGWEDVEWSRAWAICNFARLHRAEEAYQSINQLIGSLGRENLFTVSPKGIAGAPWDIFAIDGNMAGAAGIFEMLVQSHEGYVEFLPSLPTAWKDGKFSGLCIRGGGEVSAEWKDGVLQYAEIIGKVEGDYSVKVPGPMNCVKNGRTHILVGEDGIVKCHLKRGEKIIMTH